MTAPKSRSRHATESDRPQADAASVAVEEHPIALMARDFSRWLNSTYPPDLDPEAWFHRRIGKIHEEAGEVREATGAYWHENPRKPAGSLADVIKELADCVGAALGAIEHLTGHEGRSLEIATERVRFVCARVGVRERACCDHEDASHDSDGSCFEDVSTTRGYAEFCHGPQETSGESTDRRVLPLAVAHQGDTVPDPAREGVQSAPAPEPGPAGPNLSFWNKHRGADHVALPVDSAASAEPGQSTDSPQEGGMST